VDYPKFKSLADSGRTSIFSVIFEEAKAQALSFGIPVALLAKKFHILPYFHGNRSPRHRLFPRNRALRAFSYSCFRADPNLVGMISGLTLDSHNLLVLYVAAIQALAHGTRHIIEAMNAKGYKIDTLFLTGGMAANDFFVQTTADVTRCRVVLPKEPEAVLLGSAILAAVASQVYSTVPQAMTTMSSMGKIILPTSETAVKAYHEAKHRIFLLQYEHQIQLRNLENSMK
jgi:ribulose kinase